jgi:hypothetical protein
VLAHVRRKEWMASCPEEYIAANSAYPGVEATLRYCEFPFYIASSKKAERVSKLATELLNLRGFTEDSPRLYAGLLPPNDRKCAAMKCDMSLPRCAHMAACICAIESRVSTPTP